MIKDTIKSFNTVKANLSREIEAIENRSMEGLIQAAAYIRVDMERTPPLIPVDTGNLRASWFTSRLLFHWKPSLIIGFSANYAVFVHEMVDFGRGEGNVFAINWNRPNSGPKFFEACLNRNHDEILKIIQENVKISG